MYQWENLSEVTGDRGLTMQCSANFDWKSLGNDWSSHAGCSFLCQALALQDTTGTAFLILDIDQARLESPSLVVSCTLRNMAAGVKSILAVTRSIIIFLDRAGWICSLGTKGISEAKSYTRHFFLPPFWRTRGELMIKMVAKNSLVVAYKDYVVIVHGFMDFTHKVEFPAFPDDDDAPLVLRRRVTNL